MDDRVADVSTYIAGAPEAQRASLERVRELIRRYAPGAKESISYGMPTYKLAGKPLIYFGSSKKHWALYGTPEGTLRFGPGEVPPEDHIRQLLMARRAAIESSGRPASRRIGTTSRPGARR